MKMVKGIEVSNSTIYFNITLIEIFISAQSQKDHLLSLNFLKGRPAKNGICK